MDFEVSSDLMNYLREMDQRDVDHDIRRNSVKALKKKFDLSYVGDGCYSEVFSNKNLDFVVKCLRDGRDHDPMNGYAFYNFFSQKLSFAVKDNFIFPCNSVMIQKKGIPSSIFLSSEYCSKGYFRNLIKTFREEFAEITFQFREEFAKFIKSSHIYDLDDDLHLNQLIFIDNQFKAIDF